jgi:hypothetical protein
MVRLILGVGQTNVNIMKYSAFIKNRGEQFVVKLNDKSYEGQCFWNWDGSDRVYPVCIDHSSIKGKMYFFLKDEIKMRIAKLACRILKRNDLSADSGYVIIEKRPKDHQSRNERHH